MPLSDSSWLSIRPFVRKQNLTLERIFIKWADGRINKNVARTARLNNAPLLALRMLC